MTDQNQTTDDLSEFEEARREVLRLGVMNEEAWQRFIKEHRKLTDQIASLVLNRTPRFGFRKQEDGARE